LQELNAESHELEEQINININKLTGNEQWLKWDLVNLLKQILR
jgi:hypothetical protein